jgi:integrase
MGYMAVTWKVLTTGHRVAKVNFTAGRVDNFKCEVGKNQSFLWDTAAPGLGLRSTTNGAKSYIFQAKLNGDAIRITIGSPDTWTISDAQAEARRLKVIIDNGQDPRQVKTDELAAKQVAREAKAVEAATAQMEATRASITLAQVWPLYLEARKAKWSDGHYNDHIAMASLGGKNKKRGKGLTAPGPIAALMPLLLSELKGHRIAEWLQTESITRPTAAALAFRLLRALAGWAADMPTYRGIVPAEAFSARIVRDALPKNETKEGDSLQREQLPDWFAAVKKIGNPVIGAYLQGLLLTGARRRELSGLQWADVDFQWRSLTIRDKIEGTRVIPLTPYMAHLLSALPRRNDWVFSSLAAKDGKITEPRYAHRDALNVAGLPHVSLHGLRRSFGTLCEWVEVPSGISAQIMGHKPSALAEKHYRRRPLDLLRKWHDDIEVWILEQAGIEFLPTEPGLRVVSAA